MPAVSQGVHRPPESRMLDRMELAVLRELREDVSLEDRPVPFDPGQDRGLQHEEPAVDPGAIPERLLHELVDEVARDLERPEPALRLHGGDRRELAAPGMALD